MSVRRTSINEQSTPPETQRQSGLRLKRLFLLIIIPLMVVSVIGVMYLKGGRYVETDNSYVKATKIPVSTEVAGLISDILVEENQVVTAGQPLFRLDPVPFEVALKKAEARLAGVYTDLSALKASYREKQAEISLARTKHIFADKEQRRQADLLARNFVPGSSFDDARQNADLSAQEITTLERDLERIAEMLGGDESAPIEQHPGYRAALAELEQARLDLAKAEIYAPDSGIVTRVPSAGQYITAGDIAMILVVNEGFWVEANFTETELTYVQTGQDATVHVDSYPGTTWHGVVDSISPATGAEFSVIPAQNATGNWVKITQRVPVRIRLVDARADTPELRSGLSATVTIDTSHQRRLFGLTLYANK